MVACLDPLVETGRRFPLSILSKSITWLLRHSRCLFGRTLDAVPHIVDPFFVGCLKKVS